MVQKAMTDVNKAFITYVTAKLILQDSPVKCIYVLLSMKLLVMYCKITCRKIGDFSTKLISQVVNFVFVEYFL